MVVMQLTGCCILIESLARSDELRHGEILPAVAHESGAHCGVNVAGPINSLIRKGLEAAGKATNRVSGSYLCSPR